MFTAFLDGFANLGLWLQPTHPVILTLLKITLVLLLALAATASLERASAGARHLVWLIALAALIVVPAVAAWAPLPLPVLPGAVAASPDGSFGLPTDQPAIGQPDPTAAAPSAVPSAGAAVVPGAPAARPVAIGTLLVALWALGAFLLLARLAMGAWAVRRVVRGARPLDDPAWQTPLYEIADRLGLDAAPRLLQSDAVKMPFAAGLWQTTIVLPRESEAWSVARRSAVLVHELGHVRRRDLVGHTLSRVACALYWFHPLVWTAARRLRAESERACDDLALVFGARPSEYAEHLLDIVTCVRDHNTPAIALAMAHRREFEGRMLAILNPDLARKGPSRGQTASVVTALAGCALLIGAVAPVPRASAAEVAVLQAQPGARGLIPETAAPVVQPQVQVPAVPSAPAATATPAPAPRPEARSTTSRATHGAERVSTSESETTSRSSGASAALTQRLIPGADRLGALARALRSDSSASVRRVAAWGLEQYASNDTAEAALAAALTSDTDADVREMAAWALQDARPGGPGMAAILRAIRQDRSAPVRRTATWVAGQVGDPGSVEVLSGLLADSSVEVRRMAVWSIGQCDPGSAPAALIRALQDGNPEVRYVVAWALYEIEDPASAGALEAAFQKETDPKVRHGMLRALSNLGDVALPILERMVASPDPEVRKVAVTGLAGGQIGGPWPWPWPWPRPYP